MSKQQRKFKGPHTVQRRKTFKKHSDHYKKIYAPYLPAILIFFLSFAIFNFTSGSNGETLNTTSDISQTRLLEETNEKRIDNNESGLKLNTLLSKAAQKKANDMANNNYWSHATPNGKQPWQFISDEGYEYSIASENLAYGFPTASETINGWMNSSTHKQAMLDQAINEIGFGIANSPDYQDRGEQTIVVAMYARPQAGPNGAQVEKIASTGGQSVSFAQNLSSIDRSTTNYIIGGIFGGLLVFMIMKNFVVLRRKYNKSKRFILHHPAYDLTAVSLIVLVVVLTRTSGFIQ